MTAGGGQGPVEAGCETTRAGLGGRGRRRDHISVGFRTGGWSWLGASSTVPRGFRYEGGSAFGTGVTGTREDNTARDDHDVDDEDVSRGESDTTSTLAMTIATRRLAVRMPAVSTMASVPGVMRRWR